MGKEGQEDSTKCQDKFMAEMISLTHGRGKRFINDI